MPEYFVKENPESFPRKELCTGSNAKYYEITKTKDLNACRTKPSFSFIKPSVTNGCTSPKCVSEMFMSQASVTRYYACGQRSNLILQFIDQEGEYDTKLSGYKTESVVSGTKQIFKLKEVKTIRQEVPKPTQPRTIESLSYEYIPTGETLRSQIGLIPKIPQSELKNSHVYKYLPRHFIPNPNSQEAKERLSPEKVKSQLQNHFEQIVEDLMTPEDIPRKEIPMKLMTIVRAFTLLKSDDMKSLYTELKGRYVNNFHKLSIFQNLYFDSVVVSGTTPAVLFIKEMIKSQEMTKVQATTAFALMPHHIITPSTEVFESLMELIQSEIVQKSSPLYNTAILSMANLVQKACLSGTRKITYPTSVFGEFCNPQSEIVVEKFIPFLTHELKTATHSDRRNLIIYALGSLSHKDVVPTLLPIVEGSGPTFRPEYTPRSEFEYRNVSRFLSIYGLANSGKKHPEIVLPVVFSIFNNPAENTEVRIAAFNTLMSLNPPIVYLQKIAAATWSERDTEVLSSVYSYIYTLSLQSQVITLETSSPSTDLVKKCQLVLPLLKTGYSPRMIPSSGTIFSSEYLPKMNAGYKGVFSWISNYKSFIPSDVYSRIEYLFGSYQYKPFEVAFKLHGAENLYQNFDRLFSPSGYSSSSWMMSQSEMDSVLNNLPSELRNKIVELSQEHQQKILSLPEPSIRRFCELPTELRQKLVRLNQFEIRKILSIPQQQERVRIINLPEEERRSVLEKLSVVGGRYNSESRQQSEEYSRRYSQSTTGTEGMSRSGLSHFEQQFSEIKEKLHREWSKVIDQLKIESRENGPLTALAYLNFFDDISFFGSISDITTEFIHEKITPLLMNPQHYKNKVCGKTPFSFQRFMNVAPVDVLIPTDMGFPLIIEYHMPSTVSVRGHVEVNCQTSTPSVTVETEILGQTTINGFVGTFCPFTKQMIATGIKQQAVLNIPVKTHVKFDSAAAKFKISLTPFKTSSVNKPIDVVYSSVMPYTVAQSIYSFAPITKSESFKLIKSPSPVRKMEVPFGSLLGLNLKTSIKTESRYLDTTYIINTLKMFNYNPMNMIRFAFAPSVSEKGTPSYRRHEFKIQYDPINSQTHEIETTISVGVATKHSDEQPRYHSVGIKTLEELRSERSILKKLNPYTVASYPLSGEQVHPSRQGVLQKVMMEKLSLKSGAGVAVQLSTILKGSRPRTFTYQFVGGAGTNMANRQTWNIELESEPTSPAVHQKICVHGSTKIPTVPAWDLDMIRNTNLDFQVRSTVGFGRTCEESKINLIGDYKVSPKQKTYAKESPIAKECERLIHQQVPGAMTSYECQQTILSAQIVDQIDYKIKYVNVPPSFAFYEGKVVSFTKALLWPYIKHDETSVSGVSHFGQNREVLVRVHLDSFTNTFDLAVIRPEERVTFRHIPNTCPYISKFNILVNPVCPTCSVFFPSLLATRPCKPSVNTLLGQSMPVCRMEKNWMTTFDNKSMPLKLDNCFHLVSGDCSSQYQFGVLSRSVGQSQNKEIKVYLNKTEIIMTPSQSYSKYSREVRIIVNGTEVHLEKDSYKTIRDSSRTIVIELYKTKDSVIEFRAPLFHVELRFNGERLDVETSPLMKNKLCGICGDYNNQRLADVSGPKKCIYSKPEIQIASYRINSPHCSVLEGSIKEKLETETQKCAKYTEIPTEVRINLFSCAV